MAKLTEFAAKMQPPSERLIRFGPGKDYIQPFSPLEWRGKTVTEVLQSAALDAPRRIAQRRNASYPIFHRKRRGGFLSKILRQDQPFFWRWRAHAQRFYGWGVPAALLAGWLAYPALTPQWQRNFLFPLPNFLVPGGKPKDDA